MPKLKTNRGAAKRMRVKKSGKVKIKRANTRHILSTKTPKNKRQARKKFHMDIKSSTNGIAALLPNN